MAAVAVPVTSLGPPVRNFRKLCLRPRNDRLAPSEVDVAAVAVDGNPIASRNRRTRKPRLIGGRVDRHAAAPDDARLSHLARDQCGMGGAGADGGDNACRDGKTCDVGRTGIGSHQDHGVTRGREALSTFEIERGPPHGDAAGRADACHDR